MLSRADTFRNKNLPLFIIIITASLLAHWIKNSPANLEKLEDVGSIPGDQEEPLEKGVAGHSSILAWKIP